MVPWTNLSWPKKAFVAFCVLAGFIASLIGITVAMSLYVDTQVPVSLSPFADVTASGDGDIVTAEGTWTRSGPIGDQPMAYSLQTSKIECYKELRRCTEARASVSDGMLMSDLVQYEVEDWTQSSIVFREDALCATTVFTIDLNTKSVSGRGRPINNQTALCKDLSDEKDNWNLRLSSGFKIYWELKQKARPLPLRLIQTLFGN